MSEPSTVEACVVFERLSAIFGSPDDAFEGGRKPRLARTVGALNGHHRPLFSRELHTLELGKVAPCARLERP